MWRYLAAFVLVTGVVGCKPKCPDPPDTGSADPNTLVRVAKAARDDPGFCRELRAPRIALTGEDLVLGGPTERKLARRSTLPKAEIQRIDRLFDSLGAYRSQWREIHPGAFDSAVEMSLDPALETPRALSVILSTAYAGFTRGRLTVGTATFPVTWFQARPAGPGMPVGLVTVEASSDARFAVRRTELCRETAKESAVTLAELGSAIGRLCKGAPRCADAAEIRVLPTSTFGDTTVVVRTVVEALPSFEREAFHLHAPEIAVLLVGSEPLGMKMPESVTYTPRCWVEG